jgi:hypothetical protein
VDGDGDGEMDGSGAPGMDRVGAGEGVGGGATGEVDVGVGAGEISGDGRPVGYSQAEGPGDGVEALVGTCPGPAACGAWPRWCWPEWLLAAVGWLVAWLGSAAASGVAVGCR